VELTQVADPALTAKMLRHQGAKEVLTAEMNHSRKGENAIELLSLASLRLRALAVMQGPRLE